MNKTLLILFFTFHSCAIITQPISKLARYLLGSPHARNSLMKLSPHTRKPIQRICAIPYHQEAAFLYNYAFDHTPLITTDDQMIRIQYWNLEKLFLGRELPSGQLQGFHHDYLGEKEEEYQIHITNYCKESQCYQATWSLPDSTKTKQSTFFPQHFTRKEVLEILFESMYHNFPFPAIPTNRAHIFMLKLTVPDKNIHIKVIVDTQEDMIKTFYPDIVWPKKEA